MLLAIRADITEIKPLRQGEIALNRGTLPLSFQGIFELKIDLGPVKSAVTLINVIVHFVILEGAFESGCRQIPVRVGTNGFLRPGAKFHLIFKSEDLHGICDKISDGADFRIKLFRCAKDVGIVLRELAGPHEAVQDTGLFVPVDGAQFKISAGADPGNCGSSIYRSACGTGSSWLDPVGLFIHFGEIHVFPVMIEMADFSTTRI